MSQPTSPIRRVITAWPALSFDPKDPNETNYFWANFNSALGVGETVSSCAVNITLVSGTDPTPNAMKSGSCTIENPSAKQLITGGVAGNIYLITFTATTSLSNHPVLAGTVSVANA